MPARSRSARRGSWGRAYACYKLTSVFPQVDIILLILASARLRGGRRAVRPAVAADQGILSGGRDARRPVLPVLVLRARAWLVNYNISGAIEVPTRTVFGVPVTGPNAAPVTRYLVVVSIVILLTWLASNLVRGRIGRTWMAVRDMDIAAELIGIKLYRTKLLAFACRPTTAASPAP